MKTIIVPTDFSPCAYDAAHYAIALAREAQADLCFVHSTYLPVVTPYDQLTGPMDLSGLQEEGMKGLQQFVKKLGLQADQENVEVKLESCLGNITDEVLATAHKHDAGMIVMGTHGATGLLERLLGSNTANLLARSALPVLVVPERSRFRTYEHIVFATDYHSLTNKELLKPLSELAELFGSELHFISVQPENKTIPDPDQVTAEIIFDEVFQDIPHHFRTIHDKDIVQSVEQYARHKKADLLVCIPKNHGFFASLMHHSISRELSHHAKRPLLFLPEKA